MSTPLNLDDDVLETAEALAPQLRKSLGKLISGQLRSAVEPAVKSNTERNGIPLFPVSKGARPVTPEMVKVILNEPP